MSSPGTTGHEAALSGMSTSARPATVDLALQKVTIPTGICSLCTR